MLLAIDVGNTETKIGMHTGQCPWPTLGPWDRLYTVESSILQDRAVASAVLRSRLQTIPDLPAIAGVASVVPPVSNALRGVFRELKLKSRFLSAVEVPWLPLEYETPKTLGSDRLANALYLHDLGQFPAICVDFGTATKLDVVDASGAYIGGAILPGVQMMIEALSRGTAQLPEIEVEAPTRAIGRSTKECLQSGTVLALAKAVEGLIVAFRNELEPEPSPPTPSPFSTGVEKGEGAFPQHPTPNTQHPVSVFATGGFASHMAPLCPSIQKVVPHLTLEGILIAARRWDSGG